MPETVKVLYGPGGDVVRRFSASGAFDPAASGRRSHFWTGADSSINSYVTGSAATIRKRSRSEVLRNPWAKAASDAFVANTVGVGIRPSPDTDNEQFRKDILDAWDDFVEECDADGTCDLYGQTELAAREIYEGGEVFGRLRPRRRRYAAKRGLSVPLQLQMLSAEMCDESKTQLLPRTGGYILAGIEFDRMAQRVAYHLHKTHPGDPITSQASWNLLRIKSEYMLHAYPVVRAGQVRGLSSFVSVLARLKELNECDDAYITRAKIQNLYATFEQTPEPEGSVFDATNADPGDDADAVAQVEIQPGSHIVLPPGHTLTMGKPPDGAMDYDAFTKTQLRAIAAGAGVTYEQITGDLSNVNFSSIRAGLIEFYRRIEQVQRRVLVFQFLRPIWREWFEVAVLSGRVSMPQGESTRLRKLLRPRWTTPGREYVDPEKEVKAAILRVRAGFSTREMEIAKFSGRNAEELEKEFKREMERADTMEVVYDSDPRKVSRTGAAHTNDPADLGASQDGDGDAATGGAA